MKQRYFLLFAALTALAIGAPAFARPADHHQPPVATVTTTRDSGPGSLRVAIESANRNAGTRIIFQIPVTDAGFDATERGWRIAPLSPLPPLKKPDTRLEGSGVVTIMGDKAPADTMGLQVEAPRCYIGHMKWLHWPQAAIAIRANRTVVTANEFRGAVEGIEVQGPKSRANRFENNLFADVKTPISLHDGSNDAIAPPQLTIVRDDAIAPLSHRFTVRFTGKAKTNVTLELGYSSDEAREVPQIQRIRDTRTVKTDAQGVATWQFGWKGFPVGSWTATATQNGSTSEFSNTVVMPYL